jgi:hypothetical protein
VARKGRTSRAKLKVDPYLAFAIFVAVGMATWSLGQSVRLTLAWLTLLVLALVYGSGQKVQFSYTLQDLARGAVVALLIAVPVCLVVGDFLTATSQRLFAPDSILSLLWGVVFLMPAVEALYFRGLVYREKGLWPSVLLYAGAGVVYFLPVTWDGHLPILAALIGGMALVGFVYSYVRAMHGLAASLVCQATVHCVFFVLPPLALALTRAVG